ncbi:unnamed protein product [Fraxinus pennsylvanica]|uniref:CUE domain-containing protein n=1 Tax=Fraxinus pennsylvanica TaxID=56036 RepID=A0AAD2AFT2_9LAMI|nr:unnamed protein product [Fraxinus pennsylvanica]
MPRHWQLFSFLMRSWITGSTAAREVDTGFTKIVTVLRRSPRDLQLSGSLPVSKKRCCSSATSPVRFSYSSPMSLIDQLKNLFPDMDSELLDRVLEESGNNLDAAIKNLLGFVLDIQKVQRTTRVWRGRKTTTEERKKRQGRSRTGTEPDAVGFIPPPQLQAEIERGKYILTALELKLIFTKPTAPFQEKGKRKTSPCISSSLLFGELF